MFLLAMLGLLSVMSVGMTFVAYRFYRRAVIYDEVFQFLSGDIETNLTQFKKMSASNVTSNEPEIEQAHRNMMLMAQRLQEILIRMEETTGLKLASPPPLPRPKVV